MTYYWIIVIFLSAVWTIILTAPIHCRGSVDEQVMKRYISSNLFKLRNKLIYILGGLWMIFCKLNFLMNYCFNLFAPL